MKKQHKRATTRSIRLNAIQSSLNYASKAVKERRSFDDNKKLYLEAIIWHVEQSLKMLTELHIQEQHEAERKTVIPEHLLSSMHCELATTRDELCNGSHDDAVKQLEVNGRWYITMGHPGFNSPENNRDGYRSEDAARSDIARYLVGRLNHTDVKQQS